MQLIEKIGVPREVWIMCPGCEKLFYIHRDFYEPRFNEIKLHCPFCHVEFPKETAPKTWGAD
jgi:sarcosine oxidase delta subunit